MLRISHTEKPARSPRVSVPGRAFLGAAQEQADVRQIRHAQWLLRIDDCLLAHLLSVGSGHLTLGDCCEISCRFIHDDWMCGVRGKYSE
jgi:hypothetical protein